MKKLLLVSLMFALLLTLCACGSDSTASPTDGRETVITFGPSGASVRGGGAKADGGVVTIASAGTYRVTGSLDNGQLLVDTGDEAMDVHLVLENLTLGNPSDAAILVRQAKNVWITLPAETKSLLSSGSEADLARFDGTQNGAVIFSEDDLILEGEGELELRGYINNGVTCKDDLEITGGRLTVLAAGNGLRGSESVTITGGTIAVTSGNDGVKSSSAAKADKGFVLISGGSLTIVSGGDGVSAETVLTVSGGSLSVTAEGDGLNQSSKALKAVQGLEIRGGTLVLRSIEDALRCDGDIRILDGSLNIVTEADGVQAGAKGSETGAVTVSGGKLLICAQKQALHAHGGLFLNGGTVLACAGSAKQGEPQGELAFLFERLPGAAGDRFTLDGAELGLEAPFRYLVALYADETLVRGQSYRFACGQRSMYAAAR